MPVLTNGTAVPLSVAVYLASDNYDYEPNTISATGLLKPIRQTILTGRLPKEEYAVDILSLVKSRTGQAIHDSIERAWKDNYQTAMLSLGYPQSVVDHVVINPDPNDMPKDAIPVYMEQRAHREFMGKTISGKYDFVAEGRVEDFKTTSTFTWKEGNKDEDYQLQGSIYRWLNPKIITEPYMAIRFFFTDWMPGRAKQDPTYPNRAVESRMIPLLSIDDTEAYIASRLTLIERHKNTPEPDLPLCTDKELWRREPVYKYYKNPQKMSRSTKNFDTLAEANIKLGQDGGVGVVVTVPGQVTACKFCSAFSICSQKDGFIADGSLIL